MRRALLSGHQRAGTPAAIFHHPIFMPSHFSANYSFLLSRYGNEESLAIWASTRWNPRRHLSPPHFYALPFFCQSLFRLFFLFSAITGNQESLALRLAETNDKRPLNDFAIAHFLPPILSANYSLLLSRHGNEESLAICFIQRAGTPPPSFTTPFFCLPFFCLLLLSPLALRK
jgi:hypothetical protein